MSDLSSPLTFNCPTCGSPLTPPRDDSTSMICPACSNTVVIPEAMRSNHPGVDDPTARKKAVMHELMRLLGTGNKIGAIKVYREAFQVGLLEAKNAIDALEEGRGIDLPNPVASYHPDSESIAAHPHVPRPASQPAKSSRVGCLVSAAVIVLIVGGIGAWLISMGSKVGDSLSAAPNSGPIAAKPDISIFSRPPSYLDPAVLIPVGDAPSDVVTQARRYDQDPYTTSLVRLSGSTGKIVWETAPFPGKDATLDSLYTDGLRVFTLIKDTLTAYQAADGKPLWVTRLSDKLGYCGEDKDCVLNYQSVFLILSTDDNLQALDANTGKKLWEHRVSTSSNGIRMVKDQIVFTAKDDKTKDDFILFLDYKTGQEVERVTPENYYGSYPIFFDQDNLYIHMSDRLEKWDLSTASPKLTWEKDNSKYGSSSDITYLGKDYLFVGTSHGLTTENLATGEVRLFVQNDDYEFTPLAQQDNQLIVLARRTRGTEKFEIWPVDIQSGEVGPTIELGESTLYHGNYENVSSPDKYVWTWQILNGNLVIVKFQEGPNQITIESTNLKSGAKNPTLTIPLDKIKDDSYGLRTLIGWQRHNLWVILETEIYGFDVEKGSLLVSTP
jgi:outer membrane protein assembly factor BamB